MSLYAYLGGAAPWGLDPFGLVSHTVCTVKAAGQIFRVEREVNPKNATGGVHIQMMGREEKWWYNPLTRELLDEHGNKPASSILKAIRANEKLVEGLDRGASQARELGVKQFKVGPGPMLTIGAAAAILLDFILQDAAAAATAAESVHFRKLVGAVQRGSVQESSEAAERFYEELLGEGLDKGALNFKIWYDEKIKSELLKRSVR